MPAKGAVLDGRDIGTVVCPSADVKFFVTARPKSAPTAGSKNCRKPANPPIMIKFWLTSKNATNAIQTARRRR